MNQIVTTGIVLGRLDYGEADRILTILTADQGKLRLMAKGVRKVKSKLAGGIELFSVSQITFIKGKRDIGTLVSTRLVKHYGSIVTDIDKVQLGYDLLKQIDKATEDELDADYFELLSQAFESLNTSSVPCDLIRLWFVAQLLRLGGLSPNMVEDVEGNKLISTATYEFDFDQGAFAAKQRGAFDCNDIKFLRLVMSGNTPDVLIKVRGCQEYVARLWPLVSLWQQQYIQY